LVDKIKVLSSETAIKYMEEDIMKIEGQIADLEQRKLTEKQESPTDLSTVMAYVKYFVKHLIICY